MDKFDKIIKDAVEGYEAPYDAQAWANVSAQLGNKGGAMKWIVGSAAAVALITGSVYLMNQNETEVNVPVITENTTSDINTDNTDNSSITENSTAENQNTDHNSTVNNNTDEELPADNTANNNSGTETNHSNNSGNTNNNSGNTTNNNQNDNQTTNNQTVTNNGSAPEDVITTRINSKFACANSEACMSEEFIFTPEDISQSALYVWDFGDGSFSSSKVATHTYNHAGTFSVTLSLKDSKSNKTLSKSSVEVVVNPLPNVQFAFEKSKEMIPTVTFINLTEDASEWNWNIKGLKTSTDNQFEYTFRKKGIYMVELSATNEYGCSNSAQKPIEVKSDYNLLAPTAFTPNGDNKNDNFIPEALRLMEVDFTMVVYDKAGKIMYQTNNVNQPWDGTNMNDNSIAEDGAYVWTVQFKNANGEIEYYEGHVIITR
ncbi:MAG: PKD domain-containing protein [Crocinitomicaceae bacterium]|nr:PKD domain-containing protein [Crocinitomicaceae bacterium]